MKKYLIILATLVSVISFASCESDEPSKRFTLNVNGVNYSYKVTGIYSAYTDEPNYRYTELYANSDDTEEFASCILAFFYKVEGNGNYEIKDFGTLSTDVRSKTDNKYVYVQVSLGSDPNKVANDEDIIRYGSSNEAGKVSVIVSDRTYMFSINDPTNLADIGRNEGTPPANAPKSIVVNMPDQHM